MRRALCLSALLIAAAVRQSLASDISDPAGRFTATIPDGWIQMDNAPPPAVFMVRKAAPDGSQNVCTAVILATPANTSKTQEEIDDEVQRLTTDDAIKAAYALQGFKDVVVEKQSTRRGDGHDVHQFVLSLTFPAATGNGVRLKVFEESHALPGQAHDLGCMAKPENYDAVAPEFQAIGMGYKPAKAILALARSPAVTLFSDARFRGERRPIGVDVPDVSRLGWTGQTGSLGIADASPWQVCEAAGYMGRCMVLNASFPGQANTHFVVRSLRRAKPDAFTARAQSSKVIGLGVQTGTGVLFGR